MFNNANVLYKTRFMDGVSTIARYDQPQNRNKASALEEDQEVRKNDKRRRAAPGNFLTAVAAS